MSYEVLNGGKFISRGRGRHPTRIIDSDELILVLSGELDMFEEDQVFHLEAGSWLLLRYGRRHGGLTPYLKNLSFFWIHFRDGGRFTENLPSSGILRHASPLPEYAQLFLNEQMRIHSDPETKQHLFNLMIRELQLSLDGTRDDAMKKTNLAEEADRFIHLHYLEKNSVGSIADALRCNPSYLGRIYRRVFGETITGVINRLRIEAAAGMLASSLLSVKEAASACGFDDMAYFRRKFRICYNLSPGEFRRRQNTGHWNTE